MPGQLLLSGSPDLGNRPILQVRTNEPQVAYDAPPPGHNLRGMTFARYDGLGWSNPIPLLYQTLGADEPWNPEPPTGRRGLLQSINLLAPATVLFAAGEPRSAFGRLSQPGAVTRRPGIAGAAGPQLHASSPSCQRWMQAALAALPAWERGHPAAAASLCDSFGAARTASPNAPATWPSTITQGITTPFAQATAIEAYLRQFPYDLDAPAPPETVTDVADFFLFDLQRGYCDYYATAFVVLARAIGLPARFATGFAPGNWSLTAQAWTVTEAEAHSWPEVYFPDRGWIPFEPTAGRPTCPRRQRRQPGTGARGGCCHSNRWNPSQSQTSVRAWFWLLLLALAGAAGAGRRSRLAGRTRRPVARACCAGGAAPGAPWATAKRPWNMGGPCAATSKQVRAKDPELGRTSARAVEGLSETVSAPNMHPKPNGLRSKKPSPAGSGCGAICGGCDCVGQWQRVTWTRRVNNAHVTLCHRHTYHVLTSLPHRSITSVHASIHASRLASMAAGSISTGVCRRLGELGE